MTKTHTPLKFEVLIALNEFFRNGNDTLMKYIYTLFNKIFELVYFPKSWSDGFKVPIHKKGIKMSLLTIGGQRFLAH